LHAIAFREIGGAPHGAGQRGDDAEAAAKVARGGQRGDDGIESLGMQFGDREQLLDIACEERVDHPTVVGVQCGAVVRRDGRVSAMWKCLLSRW
jgi:hypothetical protein